MPNQPAQDFLPAWRADGLSLYRRLRPAASWKSFHPQPGFSQISRVYTCLVVMWLMLTQRLRRMASLETAGLELLRGPPATFWPHLQDWLQGSQCFSSHTGADNQARQALPTAVVEQSGDRIFERLTSQLEGIVPAFGVRAFFVDGTPVRLAQSQSLCQADPPGSNRHGEAHWPLLRMLVAHDLETGLAMRPQWGPMPGFQARTTTPGDGPGPPAERIGPGRGCQLWNLFGGLCLSAAPAPGSLALDAGPSAPSDGRTVTGGDRPAHPMAAGPGRS